LVGANFSLSLSLSLVNSVSFTGQLSISMPAMIDWAWATNLVWPNLHLNRSRTRPRIRPLVLARKAISAKSELYLFVCCLANIYAISKTTPKSSLNAQSCGCNSINEHTIIREVSLPIPMPIPIPCHPSLSVPLSVSL